MDLSEASKVRTIVTSSILPASVGCGIANITDPCSLSPDSLPSSSVNGWVVAHGTLMMVSGLILPLGVLTAHFLRHRDPMWFLIHRAIQVTGVCFGSFGLHNCRDAVFRFPSRLL